jgi:hypothetical protein
MARRSILTPALGERFPAPGEALAVASEPLPRPSANVKPSRRNKLHIGGYYDLDDRAIIAFQKLGIDLRKTQQEMLLEAVRDFVAKHQAASAFR